EATFRESFTSVATQLYPYWELCITVGPAAEQLMESILTSSTPCDPRIRVTRSGAVESVAALTNAALGLATGEYVAFLRAGDILPEHALYEVAFKLGADMGADIVYTDHDQIGVDRQRSNPWFKPGWDPDLLLAHNY